MGDCDIDVAIPFELTVYGIPVSQQTRREVPIERVEAGCL